MPQGDEPFHRLHLGLTTNTNFSAYLFIFSTPGKLTGWIGLPTENTASIITTLKSWLTNTELHGRTQSVRFIRTDAGTSFTSVKFIATFDDIVPVKLVLKAKQTASGFLDKLKVCIAARGDMEKCRMKKTKAAHQQREDIANADPSDTPSNVLPIDIPQLFEDTWFPCASSRGVELLLYIPAPTAAP